MNWPASRNKVRNCLFNSKACAPKSCVSKRASTKWNGNGTAAGIVSRKQHTHAEIARARNDSDRQHLRETCMAEVNAQPEDLLATETAFMSGEELAAAEISYHEMKERIDSMGPVNMMALEEFNECDQRFTFLTRERDDLLQSIADTQQAIAELDVISREKFEQAFAAINRNFSEAFHTIFGGGMAEMRLTEPDSSGDAGIDVVASPPGKRLQNVLLL